jgi:hypothetical protein
MAVREDVSCLQQLVMTEPADGAALLVGAEHALAKAALVQALPDHRGQRCGVVELPGAGAPIWSSIATTKLRVSGWSSTMKTGHAASYRPWTMPWRYRMAGLKIFGGFAEGVAAIRSESRRRVGAPRGGAVVSHARSEG